MGTASCYIPCFNCLQIILTIIWYCIATVTKTYQKTNFCKHQDKNVSFEIIFLISQPKRMRWVLKTSVSKHPKHMLKYIGKKIITILR